MTKQDVGYGALVGLGTLALFFILTGVLFAPFTDNSTSGGQEPSLVAIVASMAFLYVIICALHKLLLFWLGNINPTFAWSGRVAMGVAVILLVLVNS